VSTPTPRVELTLRYLPALVRAAGITLVLSVLSMTLAVAAGMGIAIGRVYGNAITRSALTLYVEVMRGTPVLLQLFVIYYGLAGVIRLPAFLAALIGLGLNYAAYESEIYRSALEAAPRAARGRPHSRVHEPQILRLVRGRRRFGRARADDQRLRGAAGLLVSVITASSSPSRRRSATNIGSCDPRALCAALYLALPPPLARVRGGWRNDGSRRPSRGQSPSPIVTGDSPRLRMPPRRGSKCLRSGRNAYSMSGGCVCRAGRGRFSAAWTCPSLPARSSR
jgi:polar amino acid transport system substrate-binding protein